MCVELGESRRIGIKKEISFGNPYFNQIKGGIQSSPLVRSAFCPMKIDHTSGLTQRYEQEIDHSTIVVVCQPTPLPKLGQSCVRM